MNILIKQGENWLLPPTIESKTPAELQMLVMRLPASDSRYSLVLSKSVLGTCMIVMRLHCCEEIILALCELKETQARSIVASYLENTAAFEAVVSAIDTTNGCSVDWSALYMGIKSMAATACEDPAPNMFSEWLCDNFVQNPESLQVAAACLRARRLSVGAGIKLIISDHAGFDYEEAPDIVLSAVSNKAERSVMTVADIDSLALGIRAGLVVLGGFVAWKLVRLMRGK